MMILVMIVTMVMIMRVIVTMGMMMVVRVSFVVMIVVIMIAMFVVVMIVLARMLRIGVQMLAFVRRAFGEHGLALDRLGRGIGAFNDIATDAFAMTAAAELRWRERRRPLERFSLSSSASRWACSSASISACRSATGI